ncbi:MAG: CoA-binding protein [Thermoplasmata archaeon]
MDELSLTSEEIRGILERSKTIAVVGMSGKPERPSYQVAKYLARAGYRIIPVNPSYDEIDGMKSYPDIESIPEEIDVVDIFRRAEHIEPIVDGAIRKRAKVVWMQEGIVNVRAAEKAKQAGLQVVMDRCMMKEHSRLMA